MRNILLFFCFLLLNTSVFAAEVDLEKSTINWKGSKVTGSFHEGAIFPKSASVELKDGKLVSGEIVLRMDNFTVTDIQGKSALRFLKHMKNEDFFEVNTYPTSALKLLSVTQNKARGVLTIKGKSHQVSFPIRQEQNAFVGTLTFDRTKFGMIYKSGNFFKDLGDKIINDTVEVRFKIVLK